MTKHKIYRTVKYVVFLWSAFLLTGMPLLKAQDSIMVSGRILNEGGLPLSNVAVGVEGSFELPEITNESGEFSVKVLSGNEWLNISPPAGSKDKRLYLNNRTELTIYLSSDDLQSGDDAVTVINQTFLKRNMISSFSMLNTENIKQTSALTLDQFIQGRVPGLHVTGRSGDHASGASVFMRGVNSLNASNLPLFVIDGIPVSSMGIFGSNLEGYQYNALLSLNNLDISKATVIKDPILLAAYGSKASNGLIMIETLDPSATQTVIDLDLRSGYSLAPSNQIPQLNAGQHKTLISEMLFSSGSQEEQVKIDYPNLFFKPENSRWMDYQHNTNWQDIIFRNSFFSNLSINVKGGDEIARYGLSFGYIDAGGIIKTTGYNGYNLRFVSLLNIFQWLKMNAGVSMSYNLSELKESGKIDATSPILTSLGKSPMLNPFKYDDDGRELIKLAPVDEFGVSNPQAVIDNYEAKNSNFHFISTLGFEANVKKNLVINSNFGLTYNVLKELIFMPNQGMESYYNNEAFNVSKGTNNSLSSFYNNTYLKFEKSFGYDHFLSSNTGVNIMVNNFEFDWGLTKNAHENDKYRMLQDGINNLREIGGNSRKWNWISFYESLAYSFKDRYMASATVSIDGSSRIGENAVNTLKLGGVPFGFFYAGGVGWRISGEPFMKDISWLEELKLRASYGRTGNDDIGESNATNYYNAIKFRETVGLYPAVIPNDKLTYETVTQLNAGIDLALWANRVSASFDVYKSETDNMLIYTPLRAYFGYEFRPENGGKLQNTGFDLNLFFRIISKPVFKWDLQTSVSMVKNKVLEIRGDKLVTELQGLEIVNMPGEQANSFYGYIFEGVYSSDEEARNAALRNERLMSYQGGDAKFKDISGPDGVPDGIINDYDKTVLGSSLPEQYGGINNTFTYKRWGFNVFLQFVKGNEVFNYVRYMNESMSGLQNQSTSVLNRWQYSGQETIVPRTLWKDPVGNSVFSSRWIEDGSYMRVKNISLSYTIPTEFLSFRNIQVYASASNLFTFSKYLGYDPEFAYSYSNVNQGIDYGLTPQSRQFIVGIKLGL